jgi:hypothetical protein
MFKEALNHLREAVTNRQYGKDKGLVYIRDLNALLNDWDRLDQLVRNQHYENQELKQQLKELKELSNKNKFQAANLKRRLNNS